MSEMNGVDDRRDAPTAELLRDLSDQVTTLMRQELELAKAEMTEKGKKAGKGAGMFGGAGVLGFTAFLAFTACLVAALDTGMPTWLAALIVAVVYGAIAGVMALNGKKKVKEAAPAVPEQTVETVKEDVQWAKTRATSETK